MSSFVRCLAVGTLLLLAACEIATGTGDHATGVVFLNAQGDQVAQFSRTGPTTGGLTVQAGASVEYRVRVRMADGQTRSVDGATFALGEPGVFLGPSFGTAALIAADRIRIQGVSPGSTSLQFALIHGGHFEFDVNVPLVIQ